MPEILSKVAPSQRKLQMQTNRVQRQISKLIDVYSEGLIEKQEFEPRIRDARHHLEKLQTEAQTQELDVPMAHAFAREQGANV